MTTKTTMSLTEDEIATARIALKARKAWLEAQSDMSPGKFDEVEKCMLLDGKLLEAGI